MNIQRTTHYRVLGEQFCYAMGSYSYVMLAWISFLSAVSIVNALIGSPTSTFGSITVQWRSAVLHFSNHNKLLACFGWDILQVG